jgi:hypothetical protein
MYVTWKIDEVTFFEPQKKWKNNIIDWKIEFTEEHRRNLKGNIDRKSSDRNTETSKSINQREKVIWKDVWNEGKIIFWYQ